ncbi:uncharacterized protein [Lepeophtheirus salmonis]|uniref:uncharacterized protein n=1 Tax=Lepeophtheirus salmonis TaxID=72036 RepID=UPI001AE8C0ED|nr:developmentally-regulated G-protein 3-like [Lepeophtheirus salmonis]
MERIKEIELEIARTQKNKSTNQHICLLKARLSKLRRQLQQPASKGSQDHQGFDVSKSGVARIGFIGFPSVGKSTLMSKLTNTHSEVADYEFTTLTTIPGILTYNNAKIQILDLPGIIEGAKDGRGRGKQVLGVARTCSMIVIVLDATKPLAHKKVIEKEVYGFGIRINKEKPQIKFIKKTTGGIFIRYAKDKSGISADLQNIDVVKSILHEYKINNGELRITSGDVDDLIDAIENNRIYLSCIFAINKIDELTINELDVLSRIENSVFISSKFLWNIDNFLISVWKYLDLIRIYPKPKNKPIDEPVVLKRGKTKVEDFCNCIHKTIIKKLKHCIVWGNSVKYSPMKVGKDHELGDGDVIQIVKRI